MLEPLSIPFSFFFLFFFIPFSISMYIMCVCLFSTLSRRVGALQISIIIIKWTVLVCGSSVEDMATVIGPPVNSDWCLCAGHQLKIWPL